ncbi:uncharacterized protein LOC144629610 [Oculina patagonica]
MLKLDGAFAPVSTQRGTGFCRASISPPERFVTAQLSGGLKVLYKHLGNRKKDTQKQYGSQTGADGKFLPCYPVPLLAGRYKFVQVIGQGQSSILVAAEDTFHPDKKPVAVKIMHLDYSRLGAQEADCIQQLNKADILHVSRTVQLFNIFSFESHYCLVFELLRPRPLHQYFQKCQFDNEEAKLKVIRKITLQLLQALGFLKSWKFLFPIYRENVIHADLKPENILFEEGEEIKIKVVDFGNAIHWVHREVSLYYDEFELQTLLYRAPEVMFGVPFGPEIDMWSLGCILAELYIGKPLFLGRNKNEIMQEVTSVFGPIPRNPFQSGKFFQDLSEFVGHSPEINQLVLVANLMKKLHNSRNYAFASFLVGLLQYNPSKRLTPSQAAMHPFLAPDFPFAYLLPQEGHQISGGETGYTNILITPEQYISKPHVDEDMKRQHFYETELLKRGTTLLYKDNKVSSPSLLTKQMEENDVKNTLRSPRCDFCKYAMFK